ncbi:uncharacterized protein HD556DRAFT_424546 [Suillus plorans]|uniref:DUF6535 domain-containing protein n=1 Tax=Suillus plorans TaxID=116603 RepID=A0A9P7ASQ3_9AGAM|nr:uncharacterized protein HD556DRAFT_424546 [Suillus plorans]KAG1794323.1 hypothetical protein HD556DRAFT_424546 [Suillus plorans]
MPESHLTPPAQGQQESSEFLLRQILDVLKQSTIAKKPHPSENWNGFWDVYDQEAEEFDKSFVEKYALDLDNSLIFAGLFSARHDNSLSASLLAALGAVLGKQWLRDYRDNTRGPRESRRIRRQLKVDGLETWHFEAVLLAIPALLQLSLLLFGTGLGAYLWAQQRTVAAVVVGTTSFGAFFYIVASISSHLDVSCPFTTPALALLCHSLSAIRSFILTYFDLPFSLLARSIPLNKWSIVWRLIALSLLPLIFYMCLQYVFPFTLLLALTGALYFLTPPDGQPVVDASRFVLWLCRTSLDPDAVSTAAKRIPDVTFPIDGLESWTVWGKLFRLVRDGLRYHSPSPAILIYAKALTSLYFTARISKNRFSPFFSQVVNTKDLETLRVDVHSSHEATSLCFVLTVLQRWFNVVNNSWFRGMQEGKDIINALGPAINLDDVPNDTLEWFLYPLLHGLCGAPLPWYNEDDHRCRLFLQPLAIYIIRRLLPIDRSRPLPSRKAIMRCLQIMIAILDWRSIDLKAIKTTDNKY